MKQGSSEWMYARCGNCTGSHAADIMATTRNGESAKRLNYRMQILSELLTGDPWKPGFVTPEMQWGMDQEPFAVAAYEMATDASADEVGYISHPFIDRMGGSPDRLIAADGMIEVKCPKTTTHIKWMLDDAVPEEHEPQISFYLACTGRQWCDFVSFDPRLPKHLQIFTKRLQRDEERIAKIESAVVQFNGEVDAALERLGAIPIAPKRKVIEQLEGSLTNEDIDWAIAQERGAQ